MLSLRGMKASIIETSCIVLAGCHRGSTAVAVCFREQPFYYIKHIPDLTDCHTSFVMTGANFLVNSYSLKKKLNEYNMQLNME